MQENQTDLPLQCDFLALSAMLEAARGGEQSLEYALQAARLQSLSRQMQDHEKRDFAAAETDHPLRQLEQRLAMIALQQRDLSALAGEIESLARRDTSALQFEDVESRVVVYSKRHSRELRTQLSLIDESLQALQAGIAVDSEKLASTAAAIRQRFRQQQARSISKPCPNRQNSLDHDDGEMF